MTASTPQAAGGGRVLVEVADGVATVTLNDPARRNALDLEFVAELVTAIDAIEQDNDVGAVIVTGAPPAFCAGADLSHLSQAGEREGLLAIYEAFLRVARCTLPTIAAVNGAAVGAGVNLALACDVRIAARQARFDTRFLQLGIHPGGGHTWMLQRVAGPQATAAMVLFGEVLSGDDAARCGLAWQSVDDDQLLVVASGLGQRAAAAPRQLVERVKRTILDVASFKTHADAVDRELVDQVWSLQQPAFKKRMAARQADRPAPARD